MDETTNSHESTVNDNSEPRSNPIQELVATGIGWAQYGLAMGRQSLQASARTLETAALFLGQISDRLTAPRVEEPSKE